MSGLDNASCAPERRAAFVVRVSSSRREISVKTGSFVRRAATTKRASERGEARRGEEARN